jgi:hypothetical protein
LELQVTREAARRVRRQGGALYLWQDPVGHAWLEDELSFRRPDGIDFRTFHDAGVEVFVESGISIRLLRIQPRWWPFQASRRVWTGNSGVAAAESAVKADSITAAQVHPECRR